MWRSDGHALDGSLLPPDEPGEIAVRGPMLFLGYLDPAHDEGAFDEEGWFRTGDSGTVDERGSSRSPAG